MKLKNIKWWFIICLAVGVNVVAWFIIEKTWATASETGTSFALILLYIIILLAPTSFIVIEAIKELTGSEDEN